MVDPAMVRGILETTEPLNDKVVRGLATEQMLEPERYISRVIECNAVEFPPGLIYDGYDVCSPEEEYKVVTRMRNNRAWYELARSDFYLVKFGFTFNGVELFPKYMYMPHVLEGGMMHLRGKLHAISPVLIDPGFSMGGESMFLQVTKARFTFERIAHYFSIDGHRETSYVAWCWMHFAAKKRYGRKANNGKTVYTSLVHYILARDGLRGALAKYAGADVEVVGEEVHATENKYCKETYHVIAASGVIPRAHASTRRWRPSPIKIVIRKDQLNPTAKAIIAGFFYVLDHFPEKIDLDDVDEPRLWQVLLGYIIQPEDISDGIIIKEIKSHLDSLDNYMDPMVQEELVKARVPCDTIYDTFMYVALTLSESSTSLDKDINSPWGKRFSTLRYVMADIVSSINRMLFDLKNLSNKKAVLEEKDVVNILNEHMRMTDIARLKHQNKHPEISLVETPSECYIFDVTSNMITQEKASGGGGKKAKIRLDDPKRHLHAGMLFVNCYNNLPKSDPTGFSKINPRAALKPDGTVIFEERYATMIRDLQRRYSAF